MPKVRDILKDVSVEIAGGKRKCHRNPKKHSIPRGEACLVIRTGEYREKNNYCYLCSEEILRRAQEKLEEICYELSRDSKFENN